MTLDLADSGLQAKPPRVMGLVILGQSGTSVRGAYNVLIDMMIVSSLAPFLFLFGAAFKLSTGEGALRKTRIPGGRVTIVVIALMGIVSSTGV